MDSIVKEPVYTVYKHTLSKYVSGKDNNMVYIGITSKENANDRWLNGAGYKNQAHFYNAIKKYGWDNFDHDILFNGLTKEEAEQKEIELIAKYNSANRLYGYNRTNGGNCIGTMLQETKDKISKANMGNQYGIGHKVSKEARRKISERLMGNTNGKGQKLSPEKIRALADARNNEETRRKMSEAQMGKKHSEETKGKLSESHKGLGAKSVVCIETGVVYNSIKDALKWAGIKKSGSISACCKGTVHTAGGYHWCYEEDYCEEKVKELLAPKPNKHCKPILCIETNKLYNSVLDAALDVNISPSRISDYCGGRTNYAGKLPDGTKLHWEYAS